MCGDDIEAAPADLSEARSLELLNLRKYYPNESCRFCRSAIAWWISAACAFHLGGCGPASTETGAGSTRPTNQHVIAAAYAISSDLEKSIAPQTRTSPTTSATPVDPSVYTATEVLIALKVAYGRSTGMVSRYFDVDYDGTVTPQDAQRVLQFALERTPLPESLKIPRVKPPLFDSSYQNMKRLDFPQLPLTDFIFPLTSAWAVGDFFGDGSTIVMLSKSNSIKCYLIAGGIDQACIGTPPRYVKDEHRTEFKFYRLTRFLTLEDTGKSISGCLTPRKALVADFNKDGHPDIFVACTGWDSPQIDGSFPQEANKLLINDKEGRGEFTVSDIGATDRRSDGAGFYHGASAADVDGDGYPDIVLTDNFRGPWDASQGQQIVFLMNQKTDPVTFKTDNTRVANRCIPRAGSSWPTCPGPYFAIELIDVDGDGNFDIVAGGAEPGISNDYTATADTIILYNDGQGRFGARATVITPDPTHPSVLDFTLIEKSPSERFIFIGRSYGGDDRSQSMQVFNLEKNIATTLWTGPRPWVEWWLPAKTNGILGITPYANTRFSDVFIRP